ncbi:2-haloalkanoic acid dehalogenase [Acuticoccus sediminis]|uniref:2-haloalkanoic acid dehalogenase n=1 Tax=Acuticoccus sediminis TaxID=2184697 RepID=A0A8B2P1H5_9HYPH|nr:HAD family phosphatase [Acuticoccus sediminis]RAI04006.1 2-haloalkanoic acid dehalogenase [Acuticoccus sediminis]
MTDVRHIVFDIGRVLVVWDPEIPYRTLIPDADRRRWFLDNVTTSAWNVEQDRGRPWAEAEAALIEQYPDEAPLIRAFRERWSEMVPGLLPETPAMMEALIDAGHDVTMLTNFAADTFEIALQRFPVLTRPRGVTVSAEVGLIKPDRAIFDLHAERFGLDPAATIFFDDSAPNVEAANGAGWQAHLFTSPEQMRADLKAAGLAV